MRELVPPDRLSAQVEVSEPQRDSAQEVVLPQRLCTEHAQLELPQTQALLTVTAVDQLEEEKLG